MIRKIATALVVLTVLSLATYVGWQSWRLSQGTKGSMSEAQWRYLSRDQWLYAFGLKRNPKPEPAPPSIPVLPAPEQERAKPASGSSAYLDLSRGVTIPVKISGVLPMYSFKVLPPEKPDWPVPNRIEVYRGSEGLALQVLDDCEDMEPPSRDSDWFRHDDINFDGYADVEVLKWWGATGNTGYCVWLYETWSQTFVHSKEFELDGGYSLNPERKEITTHMNHGMAGLHYTESAYRVVNNKPVLVGSVVQAVDEQRCALVKSTFKQQDGKSVLASEEVVPTDSPLECKPKEKGTASAVPSR